MNDSTWWCPIVLPPVNFFNYFAHDCKTFKKYSWSFFFAPDWILNWPKADCNYYHLGLHWIFVSLSAVHFMFPARSSESATMGDFVGGNTVDRWTCPNDRQLALRAKWVATFKSFFKEIDSILWSLCRCCCCIVAKSQIGRLRLRWREMDWLQCETIDTNDWVKDVWYDKAYLDVKGIPFVTGNTGLEFLQGALPQQFFSGKGHFYEEVNLY